MAAHTSGKGSKKLPGYLLIHRLSACTIHTGVFAYSDRQLTQEFRHHTSCTVSTQRRPRTFALVLELNKRCGNRTGSLSSLSRHKNTAERFGKS